MEEIQKRNIYFDNIKGLLIFTVVLGHAFEYYRAASTVMTFTYDLVYSFHMALFIFVSGYFSKNIEKARSSIFTSLIIPYLIFDSLYVILLYAVTGIQSFDLLTPRFAYWYLIVLAFYRGFMGQLVKIKWIVPIMVVVGLYIGFSQRVDSFLALSRTISFCWFFLAGYYCTEMHINRIRQFNKPAVAAMFLLGLAVFVVLWATKIVPLEFTMNKPYAPGGEILGLVGRAVNYLLAAVFGIVILAFTPSSNTFLTKVGQRSMIIFLGHGFLNGLKNAVNPFVAYPDWNVVFLLVFAVLVTWLLSLSVFQTSYNKIMTRINNAFYALTRRPQPSGP